MSLAGFIGGILTASAAIAAGYHIVHSFRSGPTRRVREISGVAMVMIALLVLWGVYIAALNVVSGGRIPADRAGQVSTIGGLIVAAATTGVSVMALVRVPRIGKQMERVTHMASVLSSRVEDGRDISSLGLTSREFEILEVMSQGSLSDKEISAALSLSPATAGTHVRNIQKKAALKDRADLVVLFLQPG